MPLACGTTATPWTSGATTQTTQPKTSTRAASPTRCSRVGAWLPSAPPGRRYAAAAVLLIGLGLVGASAIGPRQAEAGRAPLQTALQLIEQDRLELQTAREWEVFPLVHNTPDSEER